ncbi:MAG: hypothetical protein IKF51_03425 [Solobacterium sp.]|nr:hypothetical protein [Solobacterium sp.]
MSKKGLPVLMVCWLGLSACGGGAAASAEQDVYFRDAEEGSYDILVDMGGTYTYALGNGYAVKLRTNINDYIGDDGRFDFYACAEDLGFCRYDDEEILNQPQYDGLSASFEDNPAFYQTGVFRVMVDDHPDAYRSRDLCILALEWDAFGDPEERMNLCAVRMGQLALYHPFMEQRYFWGGGGGAAVEFTTNDDAVEYPFFYTRSWTSKYYGDAVQDIRMSAQQVILAVYGLEYIQSMYYDYSEGFPQYRSEFLQDQDMWEAVGFFG